MRRPACAPVVDVRILAILVGVAITFTVQNELDARWYVSVPAGIVGYVIARFIGRAINEHASQPSEAERLIRQKGRGAAPANDSCCGFRR
jgi:hypothetical protein